MNREHIIQTGLALAGSFLLGFIAIQYTLDQVTQAGLNEPVLYSDTVSQKDEPSSYAVTEVDKDLYAKHLTTIGDPMAGCGCPSCCAARPS